MIEEMIKGKGFSSPTLKNNYNTVRLERSLESSS